jgi:hypothetical protein
MWSYYSESVFVGVCFLSNKAIRTIRFRIGKIESMESIVALRLYLLRYISTAM